MLWGQSKKFLLADGCAVSNFLLGPGPDGMGVELLTVIVPKKKRDTLELSAGSVIASQCTVENHYENVQPVAIHQRLVL